MPPDGAGQFDDRVLEIIRKMKLEVKFDEHTNEVRVSLIHNWMDADKAEVILEGSDWIDHEHAVEFN